MKKNIFKTFGCRLNIFETEIIKNYVAEKKIDNVVILNTCAVTSEAERKAKREIQKLKSQNRDSFLIVTGCAAQIKPDFFQEMKEVNLVLGNTEKLSGKFWEEISEIKSGNKPVRKTPLLSNIMNTSKLSSRKIYPSKTKTRAFIGIQNGCDHRCTFCIIPFARGNSRSLEKIQITDQITSLISHGVKEIVLTGVDITSWGNDLENQEKLGDLVEYILATVPELPRLRISSIDSVEVDPKLKRLFSEEERLMPHLHLSLQSGDNMILKRMKRRHTREYAIKFCSELKSARPEMTFSADIIAGFPTETQNMFDNTISIMEECKIDWLHVFPFSARSGTPAARMPQLPKSVIENRAAFLRAISKNRLEQHLRQKIGSKQSVLVEANSKGFTKDFNRVNFLQGPKIGEIVEMRIESLGDAELNGTLIT